MKNEIVMLYLSLMLSAGHFLCKVTIWLSPDARLAEGLGEEKFTAAFRIFVSPKWVFRKFLSPSLASGERSYRVNSIENFPRKHKSFN